MFQQCHKYLGGVIIDDSSFYDSSKSNPHHESGVVYQEAQKVIEHLNYEECENN
jgi:ABC-type tungstate transport system permease subunit